MGNVDFEAQYQAELRSCPASARHQWLMRVANYAVFAGRTPVEAEQEIHAALTRPENPRGEVGKAVEKAFRDHADWKIGGGDTVAEKHGVAAPATGEKREKSVPDAEPAPAAFAALAAEGEGTTGATWRASSPVPLNPNGVDSREYQALLQNGYQPDEWVCGGDERATVPKRVGQLIEKLEQGLIPPTYHCANPLTGSPELTKTGTLSMRCDAAVASFRYVVAEMDDTPLEQQAKFWAGWKKRIPIPIAALIYTGGKSLHAWLRVDAADAEEWQREVRGRLFPEALVPLGCDKTCKNASRLTRAPGKYREDKGKYQSLLWLNTWEGAKRTVPLGEAVTAAIEYVKAHRAAGQIEGAGDETTKRQDDETGNSIAGEPAALSDGVSKPRGRGRPSDRERAMPLAAEYIAKTAVDDWPTWRHHHDIWHHWHDGAWEETAGDGELFAEVMAWLQARLGERATHGLARAVMQQMASASMCHISAHLERPCWLPGGENGKGWWCMGGEQLVDIDSLARGENPLDCTRPPTPSLFSSRKVAYRFDPDADCLTFKKYLADVFPNEENRKMAEWALAYCMTDRTDLEVLFLLYGDGGTGKTVLTTVLKHLLGEKNVSSLDLMDLDEKHAQHVLTEAAVNITSELPANLNRLDLGRVEAMLKRVTSGEDIKVEHKAKEPYFKGATARIVLVSNCLPRFVDPTAGLWRRLRLIPFLVSQVDRPDVDRQLVPKLLGELPGIFNYLLGALRDLTANHSSGFPNIGDGAEILREHRANCDVERAFLEEYYEVSPGEQTVTTQSMYEAYKTFCEANGYRAKGANLFAGDVKRVYPGARNLKLRQNGARTHYWTNIHRILVLEDDGISL